MGPHLTLSYQALLVGMDKLQRILNGDNVLVTFLVDVVDDRRQRRRFPTAGGASHQDQPLLQTHEGIDHLWQAKLFEGVQTTGQETKNRANPFMLTEEIHPKASDVGDFIGEIEIAARRENLSLAFWEDSEHCRFIAIVAVDLREWLETSMQAHQGR